MLVLKLDRCKSSSQDGASLSPGNRILDPPYSMTVTTLWLLRLLWGQVVGDERHDHSGRGGSPSHISKMVPSTVHSGPRT